jgi:hypothetical protein
MSSFLNQHVLVLNRLWQAVNICTARRALTLLFEGHAQVVLSDDEGVFQTFSFNQWRDFSAQEPHGETIATVSFKIRVPRVILLVMFDRFPRRRSSSPGTTFSSATATPVNTAAGFRAQGLESGSRHSARPRRADLVGEHRLFVHPLQHAKGQPHPAGGLQLHLVRKPKRPKWRPFVQVNLGLPHHDSWKHFLDLAYWNVELGEDVE